MSVASWRAITLALCFGTAAISVISFFSDGIEASSALGFQVSRTADPAVVRVDAVDAGGAAERSGLRPGDLIRVRDLAPDERYRLMTGVHPHETIAFTVLRGGATVPIDYVAGGPPVWRWDIWVACFASLWILAFAMVIGWRRADLPEARVLCVLLALSQLSASLAPGSWISPSPLADAIAAGISVATNWIWAALLATYASLVARPVSRWRIGLTALAYASAGALGAFEIARLVALWDGSLPWVAQSNGPEWNMTFGAIPFMLAIACAWASLAASQGAERSRVAWVVAPVTILYVGQLLAYCVPTLFPSAQHGSALVVAYGVANLGVFLAPVGMTYALLNRRVLDIGFALNRVAIFSGVSIVIIGAFMLFEWGLGSWLQNASHTTSLVAGAAVALVLGFSIRFVHDRVEHVLDRVFFRKRHEDEEAIRRFAREAAFVTEPAVLVGRTVEVLERHADASFARLALSNGNGRYAEVSENDPAIVALRTWHRKLDLHDVDTQFAGEFAYPMISRGRLIGALVVGPK
ncbi:MAG: hypothetical protein JO092_06080, partial [Candidatus Eremiobacteraeota bacterium]|nr:hypothetical protein [Candidatus Eremiobacteraeota bacterium]